MITFQTTNGLSQTELWLEAWQDQGANWEEICHGLPLSAYKLPAGSILHRGVDRSRDPLAITGPAWFGDLQMAETYACRVFAYKAPEIHVYRTTRPYRLVHLDNQIRNRLLALYEWGADCRDVALGLLESSKLEGWKEPNGEIMLGATDGLTFLHRATPRPLPLGR